MRPPDDTDPITLHTSAPDRYDGFSARTVAVVGKCLKSGNPVRLVTVQARDYEWLTARYGSGCQRFTVPGYCTLEDYVRLGDWTMDPAPRPQPPKGSESR